MGMRKDFFEMHRKFGHALSNIFAIPGLKSLSFLIRGSPGMLLGLVHVGFLVNDEALGIHFSTISPLTVIIAPIFYIPTLNVTFPVSALCQ